MKKRTYTRLSASLLTLLLLTASPMAVAAAPNPAINQYIYDMNYQNQAILTQSGETIDNPAPTRGQLQHGKFTVVRKEKKSISNHSADIAVIESNGASVYPGAILKADAGLLENNPTVIPVSQGDLTLSVNLPGMSGGDNFIHVAQPSKSRIDAGVNQLLATWNDKYGQDYANTPANIQYHETMAYSMAQLKTKFGTSFEKLAVPLSIDFDAISSGEKQVQVINFKQLYYTVSVDTPKSPAEFFGDQVTPEELAQKGLTSATPPVYVSNVSYGRSMYIKLETDSKSKDVQAAFKAAIKGVDIGNNLEYQNILKNTSFTAVILGGDAGGASRVVRGNMDELKQVIEEGARYGKLNPGVPIAYTTRFVKDNAPANISSQSEYVQTTVTEHAQSALTLEHSGAYVAKFNVEWDELSFDENGQEVLTHKVWDKSGKGLTAHWSERLTLPGNVRNLSVKAEENTGLAWAPWRTVYNQTDLPLTGHRHIKIWGTTLHPKVFDKVE